MHRPGAGIVNDVLLVTSPRELPKASAPEARKVTARPATRLADLGMSDRRSIGPGTTRSVVEPRKVPSGIVTVPTTVYEPARVAVHRLPAHGPVAVILKVVADVRSTIGRPEPSRPVAAYPTVPPAVTVRAVPSIRTAATRVFVDPGGGVGEGVGTGGGGVGLGVGLGPGGGVGVGVGPAEAGSAWGSVSARVEALEWAWGPEAAEAEAARASRRGRPSP